MVTAIGVKREGNRSVGSACGENTYLQVGVGSVAKKTTDLRNILINVF